MLSYLVASELILCCPTLSCLIVSLFFRCFVASDIITHLLSYISSSLKIAQLLYVPERRILFPINSYHLILHLAAYNSFHIAVSRASSYHIRPRFIIYFPISSGRILFHIVLSCRLYLILTCSMLSYAYVLYYLGQSYLVLYYSVLAYRVCYNLLSSLNSMHLICSHLRSSNAFG